MPINPLETSITISSRDCERACKAKLNALRERLKQIAVEREQDIKEEMNRVPRWFFFNRPAKTRAEAIRRLDEMYVVHEKDMIGWDIDKCNTLLKLAQVSEQITLSKKDARSISDYLPKSR